MTADSPEGTERAAEAYLSFFASNGVDYFFNSPGSEDSPFWEAFAKRAADGDETLGHLNCRHESVAVNMAKGYTLLSGRPQVVKLHVNVGPLHAAMDVHGVNHSDVPMLVLGSYNRTHEQELHGGSGGPHYLNYQQPGGHENNFARYTKWVTDLKTNANAERVFQRAFRVAEDQPPGPAFVNLPQELLYDEAKPTVAVDDRHRPPEAPGLSPKVLADVVDRLATADNPFIIAGRTGRNLAAVDHLVELAEALGAPVFENQKIHYNFPMDHELYVGASSGTAAVPQPYFEEPIDLVLVLDSPNPWYPPESGAPDADIVMLTSNPLQPDNAYWNYPADVFAQVDTSTALPAIIDALDSGDAAPSIDWPAVHEAWAHRWDTAATEGQDRSPIDPFWLCDRVDAHVPDDAIVVNETILHGTIIGNMVRDGTDRRYFDASRLAGGGLGTGLALSVGAKLAEPERFAVALIGDGSYHYNPVTSSYAAAHEHDLPFLTVLFNNAGYQSMKGVLRRSYPDGWAEETETYRGSPIDPVPDYRAEMDVWDGFGAVVEEPDELTTTLESAIDAVQGGRLALVDVRLEESPPEMPTVGVP